MTAPSITFHVGLIKTGTTWLKSHVFAKMQAVSYFPAHESFRDFVDQMDPRLPMLISNEDLSGCRPFTGDYYRARLRSLQNLSTIFPGSQLLMFFREPSAWLGSLYRQYLLEGGCDDWATFSARWQESGALDFEDMLKKVKVMNFSAILALDHADLITHQSETLSLLCSFVGCEALEMSESDRATRRKVGVRHSAAKMLLLMNRYRVARARKLIRKWPLRLLNDYGNEILPSRDLIAIEDRYRDMWHRVRVNFITDPVAVGLAASERFMQSPEGRLTDPQEDFAATSNN